MIMVEILARELRARNKLDGNDEVQGRKMDAYAIMYSR